MGVAVSAADEEFSIFGNNQWAAGQRSVIEQHFSQITPGNIMKMSYLQPERDVFTFNDADELVNYAEANGIGIHAHALVWHSDYQVPDWMKELDENTTEEEWLDLIRNHVSNVAGYFAGRVDSWDVVNESFLDSGYRQDDSLFYQKMGPAYIEAAFVAARAADPNADLYYNDFNMSGNQPKLNHVLAMVNDFQAREIPIDGIGFQMHVYMGWPSISDIRTSFQRVVATGLKVKITELDIPINNPFGGSYNYPNNYVASFTAQIAAQQKRRYCQIVEAYLDVVPPAQRGGITVWGVFDRDTWLKDAIFGGNHEEWPLLFNHDLQPKPAAQGVGDALLGHSCN